MKADFRSGRLGLRWRWIQNQHQLLEHVNDSCFVRIETSGEFFFEGSQFLRELACAEQRFAHPDEGTDDKQTRSSAQRAGCEEHSLPGVPHVR